MYVNFWLKKEKDFSIDNLIEVQNDYMQEDLTVIFKYLPGAKRFDIAKSKIRIAEVKYAVLRMLKNRNWKDYRIRTSVRVRLVKHEDVGFSTSAGTWIGILKTTLFKIIRKFFLQFLGHTGKYFAKPTSRVNLLENSRFIFSRKYLSKIKS